MAHTAENIVVHLIFSTKARRPLITSGFRDDLFAYLGGIVREMQGAALIINGTSDHVLMLVRIRPAQSAAEVARVVKANSSRWVRGNWKTDFAWQTGYGVFSVSESNVPPCPDTLRTRRSITGSVHFNKNWWASSRRTEFHTTSGTSGIRLRSFAPTGRKNSPLSEASVQAKRAHPREFR